MALKSLKRRTSPSAHPKKALNDRTKPKLLLIQLTAATAGGNQIKAAARD